MRCEFRRWLDTIDIKNLVFIDETGINLAMTRHYGRGEGGIRVYDDRPGNKGKNITLIGAMTDEGLIATMTFCGSLNSDSFLVFIKTEFRSQEPEFRMNSVRLADESRGLRPPLNRRFSGLQSVAGLNPPLIAKR